MGRFLNPDNSAFGDVLNSKIYVDKTGVLAYTSSVLNTTSKFICNSRPRRFGKSVTADMLTAYYSRGCDSEAMFESLQIGTHEDFRKYLNQYDVIHVDVQWCLSPAKGAEQVVSFIEQNVISELKEAYPDCVPDGMTSLPDAMSRINTKTGRRFVVILDEWDVLIRDDANNSAVQEQYINFLRGMFKGTEPSKFISLAYLTGILPIKRMKTQSALNNFTQLTMLNAGPLAPYVGFTEEEVGVLCETYGQRFEEVQRWYDGYQLGGYHVYNPNAVVNLMLQGDFQSYWSQTGTFESIRPFINMDFDGLRTAMIEMISGDSVFVDTMSFQNDMVSFACKDDVLTLFIHLGYLAYHQKTKTAAIPNEEIRQEFISATRNGWGQTVRVTPAGC